MLYRITVAIAVFLGVCALYFNFRVDSLKNENKTLQSEKTSLKNEINGYKNEINGYKNAIQEYNEAQDRAGKTIEKVRTIVRTVKSDCDCYNTPLPDDVRRLLNGSK